MSASREIKSEALPLWKQPVVHYAAGTIGLVALASGMTVMLVQKMHHDQMTAHNHPVHHHSRSAGRASHSSLEDVVTNADSSPQSLEDALHALELDNLDELVDVAKKARQKKAKAASTNTRKSKMDAILQRIDGTSSSSDKKKARKVLEELLAEDEENDGEDDSEPESAIGEYIKKLQKQEKKSGKKKKSKKVEVDEEDEEENSNHLDFAKLIKEEKEREPEHKVVDVKEEFNVAYQDDAKALMCSGCKLIAARFGHELDDHDAHDQEAPHLMLTAKRKAINAACRSFRHLDVVSHESGPRFEAVESHGDAEEKTRIGQRLCMAVLEDARFDMLQMMMHSKIPHLAHMGASHKTNWERFLCAEHAKLCKRREVRDDEEL